jgi:4'-phosphopantetheinyl transferase
MSSGSRYQLEIGSGEVRVWTVQLDASEQRFREFISWLSPDESERAARFRFDQHQRAYVIGRGVLRALAGSILGQPAAEIKFVYGPKGKPAIADPAWPLSFNVSNSGDLAAYAFTMASELGIDIEHVRPMSDIEAIATRFFAREEVAELMGLPELDRPLAFFNCWTRKEAYIKAIGDGLSVPLDSFCVTLRPGVPARIVHLEGSAEAAGGWTTHEFQPAPDYVGAIAYPSAPLILDMRPLVSADELMESLVP